MASLAASGTGGRARVAVVTGGGRGIGRAVAEEAAQRGYTVVFSHRSSAADTPPGSALERTGAVAVHADLTDSEGLALLADTALSLGDVHILVNNAGVLAGGPLDDVDDEAWDTSFQVNVEVPLLLTKALAGSLRAARGAVVNISSTGGVVGSVHGVCYGASKSAIVGLTKTLARELAPDVRVNCIAPGPVRTEMYQTIPQAERDEVESEMLLRRVAEPAEIATVALDLAGWTYATGITVVADGGRVLL